MIILFIINWIKCVYLGFGFIFKLKVRNIYLSIEKFIGYDVFILMCLSFGVFFWELFEMLIKF